MVGSGHTVSAIRSQFSRVLTCAALVLQIACSSYQPGPVDVAAYRERAILRQEDGISVQAAVLTAEESAEVFGVDLYDKGVQPVWLEVHNATEDSVWLLPISVDREYYPPQEVGYMLRRGLSELNREWLVQLLHTHSIRFETRPGNTTAGFVYTRRELGFKQFNVDLLSDGNQPYTFTFLADAPGLRTDFDSVDWRALLSAAAQELHSEDRLRAVLEDLPCCASNKSGEQMADPLNVVLIGSLTALRHALVTMDWGETEVIYPGSAWRTANSFVFGTTYLHSPVSPLFVFQRGQDVAFQKARGTIHRRNHMRFWLTNLRYQGELVWIGQISRDIGVKLTSRMTSTHKIDPDVDESRFYLLQDIVYAGRLRQWAYVKGVGAASVEAPRYNLSGDPYFTDGFRVVMWLNDTPAPLGQARYLSWEAPTFEPPRFSPLRP